MTRKKRSTYRVRWQRCPRAIADADGKRVTAEKGWALSCDNAAIVWGMSFRETIAEGRERLRDTLGLGEAARLVVYGKAGNFRFENT